MIRQRPDLECIRDEQPDSPQLTQKAYRRLEVSYCILLSPRSGKVVMVETPTIVSQPPSLASQHFAIANAVVAAACKLRRRRQVAYPSKRRFKRSHRFAASATMIVASLLLTAFCNMANVAIGKLLELRSPRPSVGKRAGEYTCQDPALSTMVSTYSVADAIALIARISIR
jgi:hypothetical protein